MVGTCTKITSSFIKKIMIKSTFCYLLLSVIILNVSAQKLQSTSYSDVGKKKVFPALIKNLSKEDHYAFFLPSDLTYYHSIDGINNDIWNSNTSTIEIKARIHQIKFDYKMEILSTGVTAIEAHAARYIRVDKNDANGSPREVKGFVRDYTCQFPCRLVIKDAGGKVLYDIPVTTLNETFTVTMHPEFLNADNLPSYPKSPYPYSTEKELSDTEMMNKGLLSKKIEQMVAFKAFERATQMICFLFSDYNTYKQPYCFGYVKEKNREHDFSDLDKATNDYKLSLDLMDKGDVQGCKKITDTLITAYEMMLNTKSERIDKNIKSILYYNLSFANLLSNQIPKAQEYYKLYLQTDNDERGWYASALASRIRLYEIYGNCKKAIEKEN